MATLVLGGVGAAIGAAAGGPAGARLGFSVGSLVGGMIDNRPRRPPNLGRLTDLRVTGSAYGTEIPQVWGSFRLPGNLIWSLSHITESSKRQGSKLLGTQTRVYSYTDSFAVAVCRGPRSIRRIWGADRMLYDLYADPPAANTIRIYRGDEQQAADSLMVAVGGALTPAYRGLCYALFDTLPVADWGNQIPNPLSFEVTPVYPDLILSHAANRVYYQFSTALGQLTDSGVKNYSLSQSSPASTRVTGCFQAENGTSGGGDGISIPGSAQLAATVGTDTDLQSSTLTVEGWYRYPGDPAVGPANSFEYLNPATAEYSWKLTVQPNLFAGQINVSFQIFTNLSGVTTVHSYAFTRDTLWHHVMVAYNGSGNSVLYVDGTAVDTQAAPVAVLTITANTGNLLAVNGGQMVQDELAFYADTLLAADAASHYQAGLTGTIPSLVTSGTVLADLFGQAGLSTGQYDVSAATDAVTGFVLTDREDARNAIEPLLQAYDTLLSEVDGKIVAVKRGAAPVVTLPAGDLGAREAAGSLGDPPPPLLVPRVPDLELPFRVEWTYYSQYRNYLQSMQGATRYTKSWLQNAQQITAPLVMTDDQARQTAEKVLYRQWLERESPQFTLPPRYAYLAAGDVVTLPVPGGTANVRLTQMDYALPGAIQCTAVLDDAPVLAQTAVGAVMVTPTAELTDVAATTLIAWNGNALIDGDAASIGLYLTANGAGSGFWRGCTVYISRDAGASYQELLAIQDPATLGTTLTALPAFTVAGEWDSTHTVDVSVSSGTAPASTSDADVLDGANAALVGDEIIQFATVTPLTGTTYRLSRLLRGRRGTDFRWDTHVVGERFCLLDSGFTKRSVLDDSTLNGQLLLKAVGNGQAIGNVSSQAVAVWGEERKPYSPVLLAATRDVSLNMTLTWSRRTRVGGELVDLSDVPLSEAAESYHVYVRSGTTKTITGITNAASAVVTSTAHGFSVNDTVLLRGIFGMVRMNGLVGTVTAVTTNTFTMAVNSSYMQPYGSGGLAEKILRTITVSTPTASYTAASQTSDGLTPGNPVNVAVAQSGVYGDGYPALSTV